MSRCPRKMLVVWFSAVFGLLGPVSAFAQAPSASKPAPTSSAVPGVDLTTYKVGPEDVLEISVWREDALKKEVLVRPDGGIRTRSSARSRRRGRPCSKSSRRLRSGSSASSRTPPYR